MPNPLSPAQLAEGARLLEEFKSDPMPRTLFAWADWRAVHGEELMLRVAEVEGCVRRIYEGCNTASGKTLDAAKDGYNPELYALGASIWLNAAEMVRELAAEHNIDLSEPTPAGENRK